MKMQVAITALFQNQGELGFPDATPTVQMADKQQQSMI